MLTACTDEDQSAPALHEGVLKATVENNNISSRAGFTAVGDDKGTFYWSKGDKIGVTTSINKLGFSSLTMDESGIGQATATFNGTLSGTPEGYAVYPYNDNHSMNDNTLTYHFEPNYTYTSVDADFTTNEQGQGNSFNPPMWGNIVNGGVALKHLGGVCCIKIDKLPTGNDLKMTLTSDKKINGNYTVNLSNANASLPEITATSTTIDTEKTVTITFSNSNSDVSGVFYVPMPVGDHTLRLKVLDGTDEKINAALGTFSITRKLLKRLDLANGSISAGGATEVASANDVENTLKDKDNVAVTGTISSTTEVKIPAASTPGKAKSVTFESVSNGVTLTVKDDTQTSGGSGTGTSVENLTLVFAANETSQESDAPSLVVGTPNTTTAVEAVSGTFKINELTASTADNTLIVGAGVTIKKLIVQKGNIRAKKGSVISEITRSDNSKSYIIYQEKGAQLPSILEGFTVVDAAVADLQNVAKEGGKYTLDTDITLISPLVVEGTMTLDLNGYSLKANSKDLIQVLNTKDAVVLVRRNAHLTINDSSNGEGSIDYNGVESIYAAVKLTDTNDGETGDAAKLTVNGGLLKGHYYGICGNGTRHGTETIINGGTITVAEQDGEAAIYHPQDGTLIINNGTIIGKTTGIEMRSGALTVKGGTIKSTAAEFAEKPNGNGITVTGAAVAISQHTTDKELKAIINGGTLEGPYALYEKDLQNETGVKSLQVKAGTFIGGIFSKNCSKFVTGGTFSDVNVLYYLAGNADIGICLDKDFSISAFSVQVDQKISIDLNHKTLTMNNNSTTAYTWVKGNLKLTNGNITDSGTGIILKANNAGIELDGVIYTATLGSARGIVNEQNIQNTTMVIKNSTIKSGYYAVNTNATPDPVGSTTVTLENSHFIADETALLVNIPATVTINGCDFSGNHQAAFLRGGDYTIKNSTFTLNATLPQNHNENNNMKKWEEGNQGAFAGITIGNYLSGDYQYPTQVAMEKVTVKVDGANKTLFPVMHVCANADADKGVTITYDNSCIFTTGGYNPSIEYGTTNIKVNNQDVTVNAQKAVNQ